MGASHATPLLVAATGCSRGGRRAGACRRDTPLPPLLPSAPRWLGAEEGPGRPRLTLQHADDLAAPMSAATAGGVLWGGPTSRKYETAPINAHDCAAPAGPFFQPMARPELQPAMARFSPSSFCRMRSTRQLTKVYVPVILRKF